MVRAVSLLAASLCASNVGAIVTTQRCGNAFAPETFKQRTDGVITDGSGSNCVSIVGGSSPPLLALSACDASSPAWTWAPDGSVALKADATSCLNVNGASTSPNASVILWPCSSPPSRNAVFRYDNASSHIIAVDAGLCLSSAGSPPPVPTGTKGYLDAVADCGADNTGATDATAALQACIVTSYDWRARGWPVPIFLPPGVYTVSDTLTLAQENAGPDDGINVCPARFQSLAMFGSGQGGHNRAVLKLAPNSPGFNGTGRSYKPVVHIYNSGGEGVDMNNVFANIDIDLTFSGNPAAVGISHAGAQGATVSDVVVNASPDSFACFAGLNGAGGAHSNLICVGGRYGLYIDDSQPVPVAVGVFLVNQSVSAVYYDSQESLSLVGLVIMMAPGASGAAAIVSTGGNRAMSIVDTMITCADGSGTAISTPDSLYLRDVYVSGCGVAISQAGAAPVAGPPSSSDQWLHVREYAKGGVTSNKWFYTNVIYVDGQRHDNATVLTSELLPPNTPPPANLQSRHVWPIGQFPAADTPGVANARTDCGAAGDDKTDDTAALQACLNGHSVVFLPPGRFRVSSTLALPSGVTVFGMGASFSFILAASEGLQGAAPGAPAPIIQTADDGAAPVTLAFIGIATWQHLSDVTTMDWRTRHPLSLWRSNFESRDCECLWTTAYQVLSPPPIPCRLPANLTTAKSLFRGAGRVLGFVNDDTGAILSTGATYRSLRVADTAGWATEATKLRFYSLNLEHAQSEANGEVVNASHVDIYSIKCEGNLPLLWIRAPASNISLLGMGGGYTPFPFNWSFPSDFTPATPSAFRIDEGTRDVTLAMLQDHGFGDNGPYWPPTSGDCKWGRHYPYPGTSTPFYPFSTYPNVTMWNCWFGYHVSSAYFYTVTTFDGAGGGGHIQAGDRPILWRQN